MQGKWHTCVGAPPPNRATTGGGTSVSCTRKVPWNQLRKGNQVQQLLDKGPCLEFRSADLDRGCFPLWMQGPAF